MNSVDVGGEDEEVVNIDYHYNKHSIVILSKDTIIRYALSETQRLKLNVNLLVPLLASLFEFIKYIIL